MVIAPVQAYALWSPYTGLIGTSVERSAVRVRKYCIKIANSTSAPTWRELYDKGYRVVKVTTVPEK